MSLFVQI